MDGYKIKKWALFFIIVSTLVQGILSYKHQVALANRYVTPAGEPRLDELTTHLWWFGVEGMVIIGSLVLLYNTATRQPFDWFARASVGMGMAMVLWANGAVFSTTLWDHGAIVIGMSTAVSWIISFELFLRLSRAVDTKEESRRARTQATSRKTSANTSRKVSPSTGQVAEHLVSGASGPEVSKPLTSQNTQDTKVSNTSATGGQDTSRGVVREMFPTTATTGQATSQDTQDTGVPATSTTGGQVSKKDMIREVIECFETPEDLAEITASQVIDQLAERHPDHVFGMSQVAKELRAAKALAGVA